MTLPRPIAPTPERFIELIAPLSVEVQLQLVAFVLKETPGLIRTEAFRAFAVQHASYVAGEFLKP